MLIKLSPEKFVPLNTMSIVAIDPGVNIGIAQAKLKATNDGLENIWHTDITLDQLIWAYSEDVAELVCLLQQADVVIVESWQDRGTKLSNWQSAIEVIGFVKGQLALSDNLNRLRLQPPTIFAHYKALVCAKMGRDWPSSDHKQSALTHLFAYLLA